MRGNSVIQKILQNPVYAGKQAVKAYKELPGGVYDANHEAIIDALTWDRVQMKMYKPKKKDRNAELTENLPLRGVVKCKCGRFLTGAPSRGKGLKLFYYYKCFHGCRNNISAIKMHRQLNRMLELLSLPQQMIMDIKTCSREKMDERSNENKLILTEKKKTLALETEKLRSLEEKWIMNQVQFETYDRWVKDISKTTVNLRIQIEQLSQSQDALYAKYYRILDSLSDMKTLFYKCSLSDAQEFLRRVFDVNLFYHEGIFRTPTMLECFAHNELKMNEEGVLFYEKKGDSFSRIPSSGVEGSRTPVQTS